MNAEKFLSRLSSYESDLDHIKILQERIEELRNALLPSGISYDKLQVQTSPHDRFAEEMAKIIDIERQMEEEAKRIIDGFTDVKAVLDRLDPTERKIIEFRYIYQSTWEQIGVSIGKSTRHTQRKYKAILKKVERIINRKKKRR